MAKAIEERAYAFASGHIGFGPKVPGGALPICIIDKEVRSKDGRLVHRAISRDTIEACARRAYDNETLLVPGVPEAPDQNAAMDAFMSWRDWVLARKPRFVEPA